MNESIHELLETLLEIDAAEEHFEAGALILRAGDGPSGLVQVLEGALLVTTRHGESVRLAGPVVVGEMSLLGKQSTVADVVAESSVRLRRISPQAWWAWCVANPERVGDAYAGLAQLAVTRLSSRFHDRHFALIAHDGMKPAMLDFVRAHLDFFSRRPIVASSGTGALLQRELGLQLRRRVQSGPLGGDQEIGALISRGHIEAVIFFRDPMAAHPHSADVDALARICDVSDVPIATNPSSARLLLAGWRSLSSTE